METIKIVLDDTECLFAMMIANMREYRNRKIKDKSNKFLLMEQQGLPSKGMKDYDPVGAELAGCKYLNIFPDLTTNIRKGTPDSTFMRDSVDFKLSTKDDPDKFYVRGSKDIEDADVYVFMSGRMPVYFLHGWAPAYKVINPDRQTTTFDGNPFVIGLSELEEMKYLKERTFADEGF